MPKIIKSKYGYTCECSKYWATGKTKAIAFLEWQKLTKS